MSRLAYLRLSRALPTLLLLTACLLCTSGCNNTCVSGTLNSPGGSTINVKVSSPPPSCMLTTANGAVHLQIGAASGPTSTPNSIGPHLVHLFVTLAGVDAHSSALAGDDTPGWQPFVFPSQAHPLQVDLLADLQAGGSFGSIPDAILPAGVYRQVRLRLASPLPGEPVLEASRCAAGSPHCAILSDGRIHAVAFFPAAPNLRMLPENVSGHDLYVPPDGSVTLRIEFDPDRSFLWLSGNSAVWSSGDSLLLSPVFSLQKFLASFP